MLTWDLFFQVPNSYFYLLTIPRKKNPSPLYQFISNFYMKAINTFIWESKNVFDTIEPGNFSNETDIKQIYISNIVNNCAETAN